MLSVKALLLDQTDDAFRRDEEMSLMSALKDLSQEAAWRPAPKMRSIERIVRHLAWCKSWYCQQGFGKPMLAIDEKAKNIPESIQLLQSAQRMMVQCLPDCDERALNQPIPTQFHGQSAAHFFWIMLMHDTYHAGQIRTRRALFAASERRND
jgi:uncharacterized damage-inducible protein DinB